MKKWTLILLTIFYGLTQLTALSQEDNNEKTSIGIQEAKTVPVTWENYVRAETDRMFETYYKMGGFGKFFNIRSVTPIEKQDIVRMNRDTRYSFGVFDLTNPLTVTLPDANGRYISMQVLNQDEYTISVEYDSKSYTLTEKSVGTRYVALIVRILVDGESEKDNQIVSDLQNKITVSQNSVGTFEVPNWNQESLAKLTDAVRVLAATLSDTKRCFGNVHEVNPIAHMLGAAAGWGGLPPSAAIYINEVPKDNNGKAPYILTVKDVPVQGFWSISMYNSSGYFEQNPYNAYSVNNFSAKKESNGSYIIHFGGDPQQSNFLPIIDGWNYTIRLYHAEKEILDGSWEFPKPVIVK